MRNARRQSPQTRWTRDPEKESYWKKQLDLWQKSGLSVRAFCKEHGIVETSFYAWRRELIIRARESGQVDHGDVNATPNAVKDGRGRTIRVRFKQSDHARLQSVLKDESRNPFIPLSVVPAAEGSNNALNAPKSNGLTITTPSGYRVSVSSSEDLVLLEQMLNVLEDKFKC